MRLQADRLVLGFFIYTTQSHRKREAICLLVLHKVTHIKDESLTTMNAHSVYHGFIPAFLLTPINFNEYHTVLGTP